MGVSGEKHLIRIFLILNAFLNARPVFFALLPIALTAFLPPRSIACAPFLTPLPIALPAFPIPLTGFNIFTKPINQPAIIDQKKNAKTAGVAVDDEQLDI